jgi:hypothetical protein
LIYWETLYSSNSNETDFLSILDRETLSPSNYLSRRKKLLKVITSKHDEHLSKKEEFTLKIKSVNKKIKKRETPEVAYLALHHIMNFFFQDRSLYVSY